jgi:hypothetical protein
LESYYQEIERRRKMQREWQEKWQREDEETVEGLEQTREQM